MTRVGGAAAFALVFLALNGAAGAAVYPTPPPDFSHPGRVHYGEPLFSPLGGQEDRPLLVIYVRWDDVDYPAAFPRDVIARRFFGTGFPSTTFPSVGDYFRRLSFNDLFLFPAAETDWTHNDGVVQVHVPGTKAAFFTRSERARNKLVLQLADPFVDYESFDSDGNGSLTDLELVVNVLEAAPETPLWTGCGIARGVDGVSLDGTGLGALNVSMNNTATNLITIIHETGHVATHFKDLYGFDVGNLDIGAATCGASDETLFAPNAWHKLHWGWISPTVVTQDGFYDVRRADTTGEALILYDPDRGTDDYFVVENRTRTPGTYDQSAAGKGLVIWRVADNAFGVATGYPPIGVMRTDPFARPAWDAAVAPAARTMSQPWADGTESRVAVRAIGAAGEVMRAYFDVRGPGVLVDTFPVDRAGPVRLTAAGSNVVDVPVMNTGEACDTFVFEPVQLPAGWTIAPGARILCAGESSFARMFLTPDANAAVGVHGIAIRGRSTSNASVTTVSPLSVEVVLRPTKLGLGALVAAAPTGTATTFQVRVGSGDDPLEPAVAGVPVTFTLAGAGGTITAHANTSADGVATATSFLALPPGAYSLTIETERVGEHAPTTTTVPYTIERRPTTLAYTGARAGQYSDPAAVSATLLDTLTGAPLGAKTIAFTLGIQAAAATTDAAGAAASTLVLEQAAANVPVLASFAGDATYRPSDDGGTFGIAKEQLAFLYTGDTVVGAGATAMLAAVATEEADGSPGELTRGAATFTLEPSFTAAPFAVTATLDAGGTVSVAAAGLAGDLWSITVAVPTSNGYYEGSLPAAAENLLATDGDDCGVIAAGLKTSNDAKVELSVRCGGRTPRALAGMFHFKTDASPFRAESVQAFGLSADGRRAYAAGFGLDSRPYVVSVEDYGRTDRLHAWIGGARKTSDGSLSSGNITIVVG